MGDILIDPWDLQSIMNYCNPKYNNYGKLSQSDIHAVQRFYDSPLKDKNFIFDATFYLDANPDLRAAFGRDRVAALQHWNTYGAKEGRRASLIFDVRYYLAHNQDLRIAFGNNYQRAIQHWIDHGIREGRRGSREFQVTTYLNNNADLLAAYGRGNYRKAMAHWIGWGMDELRLGSSDFVVSNYYNRYSDVKANNAYPNSLRTMAMDTYKTYVHWISVGQPSNRVGK